MCIIRNLGAGLIGLTFLLSGCSSAPAKVTANIPLVSGKAIQLIDTRAVAVPQGSLAMGSMVTINNQQYQIGNSYQSASGLNCKILSDVTTPSNRRTICQRNGQWQMLAPLISKVSS